MNNEEHKKISQIRSQLTPGNDSDSGSYQEVYSDQDVLQLQNKSKSMNKTVNKSKIEEEEERWEDTPMREHGQSMCLQPMQQPQDKHQQQLNKQQVPTQKVSPQKIQQGQPQQQEDQSSQPKKSQLPSKSLPSSSKKPATHSHHHPERELFKLQLKCDSKSIFIAYYLLLEQIRQLIPKQKGFININPYINSKDIKIYCYEQKMCDEIAEKLDDLITSVQVIQMERRIAESGIQLSYKYFQQLHKLKMTIFRDTTQNFKTCSYYICGKVGRKVLYQKLSEMKNVNFSWMHLFRYQNTRSYRAILRKLFQTPETHAFIMQKFKAKQIQVGYLRKDFPPPSKQQKRGVLIVLTYQGQKKMSIHQQIQQSLSSFIKETYAVFCFVFRRKKQSFVNRYSPKIDKVTMFFISQRNFEYPTSYLYIIVKKEDFKDVRDLIIKEIQAMNLLIKGRRFFKNIFPSKQDIPEDGKHRVFYYPKNYPYSWTFQAKKGEQFDWTSYFNI